MKLNQELIELLRQGTPLENDIDDVELLNKVIRQAINYNVHIIKGYKYYFIDKQGYVVFSNYELPNAIKLSAFKTKMVSVDELREWIEAQSNVYKAIPIDQLLTFLNSKGI